MTSENGMQDINKTSKKVIIVPHSHWDREWHLPFQKFRFKLVEMIEEPQKDLNTPVLVN